MKKVIKITESDLIRIVKSVIREQNSMSKSDYDNLIKTNVDATAVTIHDPYTNRNISTQKTYIPREKLERLSKSHEASGVDALSTETLVQAFSMLVDMLPGLGNIGSAVIDMANAAVNFIKSVKTNDILNKVTYFILGLLGLATAFIPGAGNAFMISLYDKLKYVTKWYKKVEDKILNSTTQTIVSTSFKEYLKRGGVATVAAAFFKQILEFFNKITFEFLRDTVGNIMNKITNFLSKYKDIWLVKVVHHYFLIVKGILDGTLYNMQTYESEWKKLVAQIK